MYRKEYTRLHPRFENALDKVQLIPEGAVDRVRIDATEADASGVELTLRREAERGWAGWVSVAVAKARDRKPRLDVAAGNSALLFRSARAGPARVERESRRAYFHDGTPTTILGIERSPLPGGAKSSVESCGPAQCRPRLAVPARRSARESRRALRSSKLSFYLEVTNLLNNKNECCVED